MYDAKYRHLPPEILPKTESLKTTVDRVVPYWNSVICPQLNDNKQVIVVAHGNSLRALVKYFTGMSEDELMKFQIMTAVPLIFEFDSLLNPIDYHFLLDDDALKIRQE